MKIFSKIFKISSFFRKSCKGYITKKEDFYDNKNILFENREKSNQILNFLNSVNIFENEYTKKIASNLDNFNEFLKNLNEILDQSKLNQKELESKYFRNFSNIISKFLELNKTTINQEEISKILQLSYYYSVIYSKFGKIQSAKIINFNNKIKRTILLNIKKIKETESFYLLEIISNLEITNRNLIEKIVIKLKKGVNQFKSDQLLKIFKHLSILNIKDEILVELLIDKIFNNLSKINLHDLIMLLFNYTKISDSLNKQFLIEISGKIQLKIAKIPKHAHLSIGFNSMAEAEQKYCHSFFYLDELDNYFFTMIDEIKKNFSKFNSSEIATIANSLQKTGIYDEELLNLIIKNAYDSTYDIIEENNDNIKEIEIIKNKLNLIENKDCLEYRKLLIELKKIKLDINRKKQDIKFNFSNLENLMKIIHCCAIYNYREKGIKLLDFFIDLLNIYKLKYQQSKQIEFLKLKSISKCLWSMCVISSPPKILESTKFLLNLLINSSDQFYKFNYADITTFMWIHSYFKQYSLDNVFNPDLIEKINLAYSNLVNKNQNRVSLLCLDVSKSIKKVGIPHILEINIDNFLIDIMIPENVFGKAIYIDVNGYQHFCRNKDLSLGGSVLKKKILNKMGYIFEIIPVFEWQLLENNSKDKYIYEFIKTIKENNNIKSQN